MRCYYRDPGASLALRLAASLEIKEAPIVGSALVEQALSEGILNCYKSQKVHMLLRFFAFETQAVDLRPAICCVLVYPLRALVLRLVRQ
jgi:hypothetical protein